MKARLTMSFLTMLSLFIFSFILAFSPSIDTLDVNIEKQHFELQPNSSQSFNKRNIQIRFIQVNLDEGNSFIVKYHLFSDVYLNETVLILTNNSISFDFQGIDYFIIESIEEKLKGVIEIHYGPIIWVL